MPYRNKATKVVVVIEGGIIQYIYGDSPVEVVVVDRDTEGMEEHEVQEVLGGEANVEHYEADKEEKLVNDIFKIARRE